MRRTSEEGKEEDVGDMRVSECLKVRTSCGIFSTEPLVGSMGQSAASRLYAICTLHLNHYLQVRVSQLCFSTQSSLSLHDNGRSRLLS